MGVSLRSGTKNFLHISEYGKICAKTPDKAKEVKSGSLNTLASGQLGFIESTAEGRGGDFYEKVQASRKILDAGREPGDMDYRFHFFAWWEDGSYQLNKPTLITDEDEVYFAGLEAEHGITLTMPQKWWYVAKKAEQGEDMWKEFPSTPDEAFRAAKEGAYFGKEMRTLRQLGRIGSFPFVPNIAVNSFWDFGLNDNQTIWLHQEVAGEHRFPGYFEDSGMGLGHYFNWLDKWAAQRGARWGKHYGPHGHVMSGNVKGFVNSAKGTWASFPGSPYNQPTKSMSFMEEVWGRPIASAFPEIRNVPTPTARPDVAFSAAPTPVERAPLNKEVTMAPFDASRFGPATTSPVFDASRFASPDAVAQGKAALQRGLLDQQLNAGILPNIPPAVEEVPNYVDPRVSAQPSVAVSQPNPAMSISQMATGSVAAPQISARQQQIADQTTRDMRNRGILGTLGGAVLGGALLGPVGGLLGGYLGKTFSNTGYHPAAPERLNPNGVDDRSYGGLNDYGQNAYNESKDFRDAVDSKSPGLW